MADQVSSAALAPPIANDDLPQEGARGGALQTLRWAYPAAAVVLAVAASVMTDTGVAILVLAFATLLAVLTILWQSLQALSGEAPLSVEEALSIAAPPAAEQQKRAVLQALKDLEYERSIGKVADADYQELLARYRTEAKHLLRALDEDKKPLRDRAEAYLADKLGPSFARPSTGIEPNSEGSAGDTAANAAPSTTRPICARCRTSNDDDATFCKKCGTPLPPAPRANAANS